MSRVAITGGGGQLGRQLRAAFDAAGHEVRAFSRTEVSITSVTDLDRLLEWAPDLVINAAAWTDVDGCARDPDRAMAINAVGAGMVAAAAARVGASIIHISTNEVFDGTSAEPYDEQAPTRPINAYGRSKLAGEAAVADANPNHQIVRTAWLFGPGGTNFVTKILAAAERAVASGTPLRVVDDEWGNPTWTPGLAAAIVSLAFSGGSRIVHACGTPPATRLDWARVALEAVGSDVNVEPVSSTSFPRASTPPTRAVLRPSDGVTPMTWRAETASYALSLRATHGSLAT